MCRTKRKDSCAVDQNIDMPISKPDRFSGHFPGARRVSQVEGYKIGFASCRADFLNCLLAAFRVAACDDYMNAEFG